MRPTVLCWSYAIALPLQRDAASRNLCSNHVPTWEIGELPQKCTIAGLSICLWPMSELPKKQGGRSPEARREMRYGDGQYPSPCGIYTGYIPYKAYPLHKVWTWHFSFIVKDHRHWCEQGWTREPTLGKVRRTRGWQIRRRLIPQLSPSPRILIMRQPSNTPMTVLRPGSAQRAVRLCRDNGQLQISK